MGYDIEVVGDVAAVGAWYKDGAVHIYERDSENERWQLVTTVSEPIEAEGLNFGFNVWLNESQLIVGAPNILSSGPPGAERAGKAFIYEKDVATGEWVLQGNLSAGSESVYRTFGREVNVDGDRAVVSLSPGIYSEGQESVFVFERDSSTSNWEQTANIPVADNEVNTVGIADMTMVGDQVIVAVTSPSASGVVRVFEWQQDTGEWVEADALMPGADAFAANSYLALTTDGNRLMVTDTQAASYHLFELDTSSNTWAYDPAFTQDITTVTASIGRAASLDGDRVVLADDNDMGADVYQRNELTGQWIQVANLSLGSFAGNTVTTVSVSGTNVWLGTPYLNGVEGSAYSYQLTDELMDLENDGVPDEDDNCPLDFNPTQSDYDSDLLGDACDLDDDNDGVDDEQDAFPYDASLQEPDPSSIVPAVPTLLFPSGNDIGLEAAFFWSVASGADYYVIEVQHEESIRAYEPMVPANGACSSGQCVYYKTDAVLMGDNRWRLRAGNNQGVSEWSAWTDFVVSQPAGAGVVGPIEGGDAFDMFPAMPQPASPMGDGYAPGVIFQWTQVDGVIDYAIEIQQDGLIRGWEPEIPAALACIEGMCEFVMTNVSLPGTNRWRLSARNDVGQTQWSDWTEYEVSESDTPILLVPTVPVPSRPSGDGAALGSDYIWDAVAGATHYAIEIQHNGEIRGYDDMLSVSSACESNVCAYTKPDAAREGNNRWRIGAYGDAGFSGWSQWQTFIAN